MKQLDFSNIELSYYEKFVLRILPLFRSARWYRTETINILFSYGFIKRYSISNSGYYKYKRTPAGKMYFRIKRREFIKFIIPVIISIIALLAAYDVLWIKPLAELLQGLSTILKNILESLDAFHKTASWV